MKTADYNFTLLADNVLFIEDLKNPNKATVTNSLEEILKQLSKQGIEWENKTIIQKDSEDCFSQVFANYDEFNSISLSWKHLSDSNLIEALDRIKCI